MRDQEAEEHRQGGLGPARSTLRPHGQAKGFTIVGETEIPLGTEKSHGTTHADWRRGWRKWKDNVVVSDRVVKVADNPAPPVERDEMDASTKASGR